MLKNNYLFYKDYLKNRKLDNKKILVARTNNSYLLGPKIDFQFDEFSFYKRLISNSIYSQKIYKRMFEKKVLFLIDKYGEKLSSNEVIEIFKDETYIIHKIIKVPGDDNEKK